MRGRLPIEASYRRRLRPGQRTMKLLAAALTACLLTAQQTTSPVSPEKLPNTAPAPQPTSERPKGWLDQTTMTGDWDGKRTTLDSWGIDLRAHLLTESAANPVGGKIQAACYTQQVDFGADIDLGRLIGFSGGEIQIPLTARVGRSLTADAIGNEF